jgi:hypothetical protein
MTQYNLKPGLRKFGECKATAAISVLTQLHVMDTWAVMDPTKLTRDDRTRALLSLLFLRRNDAERSKAEPVSTGHHRERISQRRMWRCGLSPLS